MSFLPADSTHRDPTVTVPQEPVKPHLLCRNLPGADETLVVLRTGATELQDRFPIHLSTTLKCYPHYMLFSDHEEVYKGEKITDALSTVTQDILSQHPDFELHRRLLESGREALLAKELSGSESEAIQWTGKADNPGWKLDKWKFLPMVNQTFHERPDMKWYLFVEADTYVLWASLLEYLAVLDHTKPVYTGSQMYIGDVVFAHGGSGFIVSRSAMRMVVEHYAVHKGELESFTDGHWAGDCVLGKAFRDAGVKFVDAWPIMQGDYPGTVPYAKPDGRPIADPTKRVWCYPTVSYHHLSPAVVEDLWHFEQDWIADNRSVSYSITCQVDQCADRPFRRSIHTSAIKTYSPNTFFLVCRRRVQTGTARAIRIKELSSSKAIVLQNAMLIPSAGSGQSITKNDAGHAQTHG